MFYLKNLKDKYKASYICDTLKSGNHYSIHDEPQTTLPKKHPPNTKREPNSNWPKTRQQKRKGKSN